MLDTLVIRYIVYCRFKFPCNHRWDCSIAAREKNEFHWWLYSMQIFPTLSAMSSILCDIQNIFIRLNSATFLCLFKTRTWIFNVICHGLFCVQWVKARGDCSFCWYWWNCLSSLFKHSFLNSTDLSQFKGPLWSWSYGR